MYSLENCLMYVLLNQSCNFPPFLTDIVLRVLQIGTKIIDHNTIFVGRCVLGLRRGPKRTFNPLRNLCSLLGSLSSERRPTLEAAAANVGFQMTTYRQLCEPLRILVVELNLGLGTKNFGNAFI